MANYSACTLTYEVKVNEIKNKKGGINPPYKIFQTPEGSAPLFTMGDWS